jgi:type II secretory pathway predicted ATPase ExeA/phage tail protein X
MVRLQRANALGLERICHQSSESRPSCRSSQKTSFSVVSMYTAFYNLKERPFELTPSPRFLYLGEVHKEALAFLTYGVVERKGFVLLTGDVGTGKTTMLKALLSNLDEGVQYVYISNPPRSADELFDALSLAVFKRNAHFKSKPAFLAAFEAVLRQYRDDRINFMLIIDEAHVLSFEVLEEIRLLSNLETEEEKLVNVFLVGQPELNKKLSDVRCRALLQRIGIRSHITPLGLEDTSRYIAQRLKVAGAAQKNDIFPEKTVKAIYEHSGGYPRMINVLADNALLLGYAKGKRRISPAMVEASYGKQDMTHALPGEPEESGEVGPSQKPMGPHSNGYWKWAAALVFATLLAFLAAGPGQHLLGKAADLFKEIHWGESEDALAEKKEPLEAISAAGAPQETLSLHRGKIEKEPQAVNASLPEPSITAAENTPKSVPLEAQSPGSPDEVTAVRTVTVKAGNTVAELALDVYGRFDRTILELLQAGNPQVVDLNRVMAGQQLIFPPLPKDNE